MAKKKVVTVVPGQGIPAVVDPNPARTLSDAAEDAVTANTIGDAAALQAMVGVDGNQAALNKAADEQAHADEVQDNAQDQLDQHEADETAADEAFDQLEDNTELVQQIMADHSVSTLYENSKGEYFLVLNLALNSEGGNKDRVKTHNA